MNTDNITVRDVLNGQDERHRIDTSNRRLAAAIHDFNAGYRKVMDEYEIGCARWAHAWTVHLGAGWELYRLRIDAGNSLSILEHPQDFMQGPPPWPVTAVTTDGTLHHRWIHKWAWAERHDIPGGAFWYSVPYCRQYQAGDYTVNVPAWEPTEPDDPPPPPPTPIEERAMERFGITRRIADMWADCDWLDWQDRDLTPEYIFEFFGDIDVVEAHNVAL